MTAKEYLKSIGELDSSIDTNQRKLERLEHDKARLCALTYDSVRVQSSIHSDPTEIIDKIDKLQRKINQDIDRLVDLKAEAEKRIARVYNPKLVAVLTDRYVNCMSIEKIAEKANVSRRTACVWNGQALQIFRKENNML